MPKADIDFTDTESSGGGYLKEGVYRARLDSVEERQGREYPLWAWSFVSVEPETYGDKSQHTTSLSPKAAFFVRQVIEGLGAQVPQSMASINTDNYIGREAMVVVAADGQFEGRDGKLHDSFKIQRVFPIVGTVASGAATTVPDAVMADLQAADDDIPF